VTAGRSLQFTVALLMFFLHVSSGRNWCYSGGGIAMRYVVSGFIDDVVFADKGTI